MIVSASNPAKVLGVAQGAVKENARCRIQLSFRHLTSDLYIRLKLP